MDYVLNIILPKKEIKNARLKEKLIEWGENVYSCSPPRYVTNSNIIFEQVEDVQYFSNIIGEELTDSSIVLHLKSDIIFDLVYVINNNELALEENELLNFLSGLFDLSKFYILLIREDEKVKERYKIEAREDIGIRLFNSLKYSNPKDVLLYKEGIDLSI